MRAFLKKYFRIEICNKSGEIRSFQPKKNRNTGKLVFMIAGFVSTLWILYRVITKPSRILYPCVRAAAPFASSFFIYLIGSWVSFFTFKKLSKRYKIARYLAFASVIVFVGVAYFYPVQKDEKIVYANTTQFDTPNSPIGNAIGVQPGRVVWAHDPEATDENWKNDDSTPYYDMQNYDLDVIEAMIDKSILELTGETTLKDSWDAMFKYFNKRKGKGEISYQDGEKIFIKINTVGSGWGATDDNFELKNKRGTGWTSPPVVLVILRHLVNEVGVPQEDISVGDPMNVVIKPYHDLWSKEFPGVNFVSRKSGTGAGRIESVEGSEPTLFYSDKGTVLRTGDPDPMAGGSELGEPVYSDSLYTVIEEADYMINMAALKIHERNGVSLCAKNNFGSHTRERAQHLHMGLVSPNGKGYDDSVPRFEYGQYRVLVDLMGHEKLGGNTILFFIDGLWGGTGAIRQVEKYIKPPFENDYPSSVFLSMDGVAIESVCLDFMKAEFTEDNPYTSAPQMPAVDDYLRQAADASYWPEGLIYDPENDGTPIPSMGVHEHWNNADDRQYSRNLGTGDGIELVKVEK